MKNKIHASMQKEASEFMKDPKKKMREWWDKWWEFMKDPKKKMREWWGNMCTRWRKMCKQWDNFKFNHPWWACSLQYGGLALVILVGHILFGILSDMTNVDYFRYPLNETFRHPFNATANLTINRTPNMQGTEIYAAEMYADNARSILCTLVGSEAAIVAIVVSLTLIAIELTASAYSPRVIKISLRNPDMWILLTIYGVAIFSSIILLKQLPYESRFPTEDVSLAFWFGVFSYVALFPYLSNIIQLLNPTNIVRRVSEDIVKDNILTYIKDPESEKVKNDKENPIQLILDIIYKSINNYDLETVRKGLEEIGNHAKKVIIDSSKVEEMSFSRYFCDPLKRIGRLAASKDDEGSTIEVIKKLETFGEYTAEAKLNAATEQVVKALGAVGIFSAEKGKAFEEAVNQAASSLGAVGKAAADKGEEFKEAAKQAASSLKEVGKDAADNRLEEATKRVASSLGAVGKAAADKGLDEVTKEVASSLGDFGENAAKKELEDAAKKAAAALGAIGKAAANKGLDKVTIQAAKSLEVIGKAAGNKGLDEVTKEVASSLGEVGKSVVDKGGDLEGSLKEILKLFKELGKSAAENHEEGAVTEITKSLKELGMTSSEDEVIKEIASAIGTVGVETVVNELGTATLNLIEALSKFGDYCLNNHKDATFRVFRSLENIGKNAKNTKLAKETLNEVLMQAALAVYAIGEKKKQDYADRAIETLKKFKEIAEDKQLESKELIDIYIKDLI